jgi:hypothetical protein
MKVKNLFSAFFCFITLLLYATSIHAQEALPGELLLKFKTGVPQMVRSQVLQAASLSIPVWNRPEIRTASTKELAKIDVITVYIPENMREMFMSYLAKDKNVEFVEPNFQAQKTASTNDPSLKDQWCWHQAEQKNH